MSPHQKEFSFKLKLSELFIIEYNIILILKKKKKKIIRDRKIF
jgi:hypothetical protein